VLVGFTEVVPLLFLLPFLSLVLAKSSVLFLGVIGLLVLVVLLAGVLGVVS
jgi:hypothetical protein